jgi:hypothetical protein
VRTSLKLAAVSARPPSRFPRTSSAGTLTPSSANCGGCGRFSRSLRGGRDADGV